MPNTLGHLCVQGWVTRAMIRGADLKWICLGAVIPDAPWILHRVLRRMLPDLSPYDLRLYAMAQSSLLLCLVLSSALAATSSRPWTVLRILALGSTVHLLLDACQTKWANGVHLFAPFSWRLDNLGWFWPESVTTVALTAAGLVWIAWARARAPGQPVGLGRGGPTRWLATGLLAIWLALPLALMSGPEAADNHSVHVLRDRQGRPGRTVAFDRAAYLPREGQGVLRTFAGEELTLSGWRHDQPAMISVRGRFTDETSLEVDEVHLHWPLFRDLAAYAGLAAVAGIWLLNARRRDGSSPG